MTDQQTIQQQSFNQEFRQFFAIKTDLVKAQRSLLATDLTESARAAIDDDVVFHFNELIAMEMHTDNSILRRACAAVIDGQGFDRETCVSTAGISL